QLSQVRSLEPLTSEAVTRLVSTELGDAADAELCSTIAAATGGNPFYVRELVAGVRAGGRSAAPEVVAGGSAAPAILARIGQLPEAAAALAEATAVLGDGAPLERAADLAGIGVDEAATAADQLAAAAILEPGTPLSF